MGLRDQLIKTLRSFAKLRRHQGDNSAVPLTSVKSCVRIRRRGEEDEYEDEEIDGKAEG